MFSIPKAECLLGPFELLHLFAIWAVSDPCLLTSRIDAAAGAQFEPVSVTAICKYLAVVQAWNIAQGWLAPLLDNNYNHINWLLLGL